MRERLYEKRVANEEFLLTYRPGQHMLDIGNPQRQWLHIGCTGQRLGKVKGVILLSHHEVH